MTILKRIFGICETGKPEDAGAWKFSNGKVEIEWSRVPELRTPCGAVRLEGRGLPERILVVYGIDGQFHAFKNRCPHMGRRLDPVVGSAAVRCCSLFISTFDYTGNVMSGPAKESLKRFRVETQKCKVVISLK